MPAGVVGRTSSLWLREWADGKCSALALYLRGALACDRDAGGRAFCPNVAAGSLNFDERSLNAADLVSCPGVGDAVFSLCDLLWGESLRPNGESSKLRLEAPGPVCPSTITGDWMLLSDALLFATFVGIPWPRPLLVTVMTSPNRGCRLAGDPAGRFLGALGLGFGMTFLAVEDCADGGRLWSVFAFAGLGELSARGCSPLVFRFGPLDEGVRDRGGFWVAACPGLDEAAEACSISRIRFLIEPLETALGALDDPERALTPFVCVWEIGFEPVRPDVGGAPGRPF